MFSLAWGSVRARAVPSSGAVLVLGLAALIVSTCLILLVSAALTAPGSGRFAAATAVVRGAEHPADAGPEDGIVVREPAPLPLSLAAELRSIDDVAAVIPDRSFYAQVLDRSGDASGAGGLLTVGHPWSTAALAPYRLVGGTAPAKPAEVVLDAGLARVTHAKVGDQVRVATDAGIGTWRVSGVAASPQGSAMTHSAVFFSATYAGRLYPRGSDFADAFGVVADPGHEEEVVARVSALVGDEPVDVLTGGQRGRAEPDVARSDFTPLREFLGTSLVLAGCVAAVIVAGAFGFIVAMRRRELAVLRAVAATPAQVRRMVLGEGLLIALAGALLAAPVSVLVSNRVATELHSRGVAPASFAPMTPWAPVVGVVGGGGVVVVVTLLACWSAARSAARVSPVEALRAADAPAGAVGRRRVLSGVLCLAGALSAPAWTAATGESLAMFTPVVLLLLAIAMSLVGPAAFAWPARAIAALLVRVGRGPAVLVQAYCRTAPARVAATGLPVMLLVGLVGGFLLIGSSVSAATTEQSRRREIAEFVVISHGASGLPPVVAAQIRAVPGVGVTVPAMGTTVFGEVLGEEEARPALGVTGSGLSQVLDLDVTAGSLDHLGPGAVAVSEQQAHSRGWEVGHLVGLRMNDGKVTRVRVVATYRRSLGFADYLLSRRDAVAHTANRLDTVVYVALAPGASEPVVHSRLVRALSTQPTATLAAPKAVTETADRTRAVNDWAAFALAGLIGAFVIVAAANTVVASVVHRAVELNTLRLLGATRAQVVRVVVAEAAVVAAAGLAIALTVLVPTASMLQAALGDDVIPVLDAETLLLLAMMAVASAVIPAGTVASLVLRVRP